MRITLKQLKQLIREQVEEITREYSEEDLEAAIQGEDPSEELIAAANERDRRALERDSPEYRAANPDAAERYRRDREENEEWQKRLYRGFNRRVRG